MRLGVDIGGTEIKFLVLDGKEITYRCSIPTEKTSTDKFVSEIIAEAKRIIKDFDIESVGFGVPGGIKNGVVSAGNLPLNKTPLLNLFSEGLNMPIKLENDANCAALGEMMLNKSGYKDIVLVTLGTGIGGGIVLNGKLLEGRGSVGEVGHMIVEKDGLPCSCGTNGCWEQYASATALIREAKKEAKISPDSLLASILNRDGDKFNGKSFFEAYNRGCPKSQKVFSRYLDWLAIGTINIIRILEPDAVIFAGGITKQGDKFINGLRERVYSQMEKTESKIEISQSQSDTGGVGAAVL